MDELQIEKFLGNREMSIVDAMGKIDNNSKGLLFIVDEKKRLIGSLTDGDIRRWLIRTGELDANIGQAMKQTPRFVFSRNRSDAIKIMQNEKLTAIPVLNEESQVEDILFGGAIGYEEKDKYNKALSKVPTVIMAGGKGTRLYPYTKVLPKPLIPIGETPIIERIIDRFTIFGVNQFYLTVNYKRGMIKSYFEDLNPSYKIVYVEENEPLGTGGSLRLIEDKLEIPVFVANCDCLILADYTEVYAHHIQEGNDVTIVSALKNITVPYGVLQTKENGELVNIQEKPRFSYFVNTGMYVINPEIIKLIPSSGIFHMTDLINAVREKNGKVGVYPVSEDSFLDMGEFDGMHRMEERLHIIED